MSRVLVVDDEEAIRFAFEQFLKDEGHEAVEAGRGEEALRLLRDKRPELVFLDYRLPGMDGLQILREIRASHPTVPVIFMTAFGAMDVAIKAMQLGADEYLTKPLDLDRVRVLMARMIKKGSGPEEYGTGKLPASHGPLEPMVGKSLAMQEVFKMIGLLSLQDVTVLISGESGVGKELVARAIHENGPRKKDPFVAVNCGAVPDNLLEAEMFGYEKGAFTGAEQQRQGKFELAGSGTLFLDEIAEFRPPLQVKLLRVLQERVFDRIGGSGPIRTEARVLAATNRDLAEEVRSGRLRRDLFYRLHIVHIHIPPLRERKEDIPGLVDHFILKENQRMDRHAKGVTEEGMKRLMTYAWPGNVRELENRIKRAMVLSREDLLPVHLFDMQNAISPETVSNHVEGLAEAASRYFFMESGESPPSASVYQKASAIVEKTLIREALGRTGGNRLQAAQLLGMNRSTLRKKMRDFGL